jgi:hypothetical protein
VQVPCMLHGAPRLRRLPQRPGFGSSLSFFVFRHLSMSSRLIGSPNQFTQMLKKISNKPVNI